MATATASVHANQAPPRLRLVHPPLDLESISTEWEAALDAAERAVAASTPLLRAQEVAERRERLRMERTAVAVELRRFARLDVCSQPKLSQALLGECRSADAWLTQ